MTKKLTLIRKISHQKNTTQPHEGNCVVIKTLAYLAELCNFRALDKKWAQLIS